MAAPGKSCGSCGLCCKLLRIEALDKPAGPWCARFKPGAGCTIYDDRPGDCRTFECDWLGSPGLPEAWRPDRSRMILIAGDDGLRVIVDPATPAAWRREPYYGHLKRMAGRIPEGGQLIVSVGERRIVLFPDQDIDLGVVPADARIVSGYAVQGGRRTPYARMVRDPGPPLPG